MLMKIFSRYLVRVTTAKPLRNLHQLQPTEKEDIVWYILYDGAGSKALSQACYDGFRTFVRLYRTRVAALPVAPDFFIRDTSPVYPGASSVFT